MTQCGHPAMPAVVRSTSHNHTQVLDRRDHSALMLAARITLAHFSVYSMINLPNSSGEVGNGASPSSEIRSRILASASAFDDVSGSILGRSEALPPARLITWHKVADGGNVRQYRCAHCAGHPKRAQFAGPDVLNRPGQGGEVHLHLPTKQVDIGG